MWNFYVVDARFPGKLGESGVWVLGSGRRRVRMLAANTGGKGAIPTAKAAARPDANSASQQPTYGHPIRVVGNPRTV